MNCAECELIKSRKNLIYEDADVAAFLAEKPAMRGHSVAVPKQHFPIIEKLPDNLVGHLFIAANAISALSFEILKAEGTNILIQNGIAAGQKTAHVQLNILPRHENDGLNFQWNTMKMSEDELSATQLMLKEEIEKPHMEKEKPEEKRPEAKEEKKEEIPESENYLLKQLERMP